MKTLSRLRLIPIVLLLCVMLPGFADAASKTRSGGFLANAVSEEFELTAEGKSGMEIRIEHTFGSIDVIQGRGSTIRMKGTKKVASSSDELAKMFLDSMEIRIRKRNNTLEIETYYPEKELSKRDRKRIKEFNIDYTIEVPADVRLSLKSSFGGVRLDQLSGEFTVTNSFGTLSARAIKGSMELNNKFGPLKAENINGSLQTTNEHGSLDIINVSGDCVARTSFSSAKVAHVSGTLRVNNNHGSIRAEDIGRRADLETSFGSLDCSIVKGPVEAKSGHGSVTVRNVEGDVRATTSFAHAAVMDIHGDAVVNNQHGSVDLENIGGSATVSTSFGSCNISKIAGSLNVRNQNSSINAFDLLPGHVDKARIISLTTSHGSIRASFPEDLSAKLNAFSSFGKFRSDFPVLMTIQGAIGGGNNQSRITGSIGEGRDELTLEANHGNVTILNSGDGGWNIENLMDEQ